MHWRVRALPLVVLCAGLACHDGGIDLEGTRFVKVQAGSVETCGERLAGAILCWGSVLAEAPHQGGVDRPTPVPMPPGFPPLRAVFLGNDVDCGVTASGESWCWGLNFFATLGSGSTSVDLFGPTRVATTEHFVAFDNSSATTCAINTEGRPFCWGAGAAAGIGVPTNPVETCRLGTSEFACYSTPQPLATNQRFEVLTAGWDHMCALTAAGEAWCWGYNYEGMLGVPLTVNESNVPIPVETTETFVSIAAGETYTCGVTGSGSVYCWGRLRLGVNASTLHTPIALPAGVRATQVSVGLGHACLRASNGGAWCWGANGNGQLGNGSTAFANTPVAVLGGLEFSSVTAGTQYSCGVTEQGAWRWGIGGLLGTGEFSADSPIPLLVVGQESGAVSD